MRRLDRVSFPVFQRFDRHCEGQHEGERRVEETHSAIAFVPRGGAIAFGVDQQSHAADFPRRRQASLRGAQEKPPAKPATLHAAFDGEPAEAVNGDFIAAEAARRDGGRAAEFEPKPDLACKSRGCARAHRARSPRNISRRRFHGSGARPRAVERRAVVAFANRPLVPDEGCHSKTKPALAARQARGRAIRRYCGRCRPR